MAIERTADTQDLGKYILILDNKRYAMAIENSAKYSTVYRKQPNLRQWEQNYGYTQNIQESMEVIHSLIHYALRQPKSEANP